MALIGYHNDSKAISFNRLVYITGESSSPDLVWLLILSNEALVRYNRGEFKNDKVLRYCEDKRNIGIWITPCPSGLYKYYIRAATGDIMKDFSTLILSRTKEPELKEISAKEHIELSETVEEFFKKNDYFKRYKK